MQRLHLIHEPLGAALFKVAPRGGVAARAQPWLRRGGSGRVAGKGRLVTTPLCDQFRKGGREKKVYFANRYAPPFSIERWNAGRACIRDSHALKFGYGPSLSNTFAISPTKLIWISSPVSDFPTKNSLPVSAPST